jgi:hypothetical protein
MTGLPDIQARLERYRKLYSEDKNGSLIISTDCNCGEYEYGRSDLRCYDFSKESGHRLYWDYLIEKQFEQINSHKGIEDDWIPGIIVHYGFGAFGAVFCDAGLTFTEDTSFMEHQIESLDSFVENYNGSLYLKDRFWSRMFIEASRYISEKSDGQFMVDAYPSPSPLDIVNLLRGNALFTDFYDKPQQLKKLLEYATNGAIENIKAIQTARINPWGGTLAFGRWVPTGPVLLEDAADLISPELYREFGMPYTQKVIDAMGGAYIHHHSLGKHQFANIAGLRGLYVEQISSDPNCVRPVNDLEFVLQQVGERVVELECNAEEVYNHINQLKQGKFILNVHCRDKNEAMQLVQFVRKNSII